MKLADFAVQMPKAELHVHLEGSIRPATLLKLAERNRINLPASDEDELHSFYRFRDFSHFIEVYIMTSNCLRTPDDYELIAYEFGHRCAAQNVRYAEPTFTIYTNMRLTGLTWQEILSGLNTGRERARQDFGVDWNWVFDISRNNPETQMPVCEIAIAARDQGVVALGLGGSEAEYPPELFVTAFDRAWQAGLPRVPHAGETAGPASIWSALKDLKADRIGHGVRSNEDPALVEYLRDRQIPLEVCPTSNIRLGVYSSFTEHPLRDLWEEGLLITLGSDDPPMFETDINQEYLALVEHFGFGYEELKQISLNGLRASLLPRVEKERLIQEFEIEFARLREL